MSIWYRAQVRWGLSDKLRVVRFLGLTLTLVGLTAGSLLMLGGL